MAMAGFWLAAVLAAQGLGGAQPFAYRMEVTPEEGPLDHAVQARYTPALTACQDKAEGTDGNARCFVAEFARQDAALNRAWPKALARVGTARAAALRTAQRRWIGERDPFCEKLMKEFEGGTFGAVAYHSCRAELTIRRTMWLEKLR